MSIDSVNFDYIMVILGITDVIGIAAISVYLLLALFYGLSSIVQITQKTYRGGVLIGSRSFSTSGLGYFFGSILHQPLTMKHLKQ